MRSFNPWASFPLNLEKPVARSLSIQFILQELSLCFQFIASLSIKDALQNVETELEKLLLFSFVNPFAQKRSMLDKLCFYCEILLQNSIEHDCEALLLLEEMRTHVLKMKSQLNSWKKLQAPIESMQKQFDLSLDVLTQKLQLFFHSLLPFFQEGRSDENMLAYLLEKKDCLNPFLGSFTVDVLLQQLFPRGKVQLHATIQEGYRRRGFLDYFKKIEPILDELKW